MKQNLIKVGDVVILKESFLKRYDIPLKYREAEVTYYNGKSVGLYNEKWESEYIGDFLNEIIVGKAINDEIQKLLELDLEFVSFTAKTIDGKEIKISK